MIHSFQRLLLTSHPTTLDIHRVQTPVSFQHWMFPCTNWFDLNIGCHTSLSLVLSTLHLVHHCAHANTRELYFIFIYYVHPVHYCLHFTKKEKALPLLYAHSQSPPHARFQSPTVTVTSTVVYENLYGKTECTIWLVTREPTACCEVQHCLLLTLDMLDIWLLLSPAHTTSYILAVETDSHSFAAG